jgi:hypothetical protein
MRIVLSIVVALLISTAMPVHSAYAYGGGSGGGASNPEGDTSAPISFTGTGSFQPGFHSNVTLNEFKGPLKFDHSRNREINFWFTMLMWTEIFDQAMGLATLPLMFIKVPAAIVYQGPKNVVRLIVYGEARTIKLNEGLQSSPGTRNISGWLTNKIVLKPLRWVRKKVFEK